MKYKEEFHKTKDKYTPVTETVDSERVQSLKHLYSDVSVSTHFFFFSSGPLMWDFYFISLALFPLFEDKHPNKELIKALLELGGDVVFQARAIFSNCNSSLGKTPGLINGFPE